MKVLLPLLCVVLILQACEPKEYTKIGDQVYVKLVAFDEASEKVEDHTYIALNFGILDSSGSRTLHHHRQVYKSIKADAFGSDNCFSDFQKRFIGDSISYILPCKELENSIFASSIMNLCENFESRHIRFAIAIENAWTEQEYSEYLSSREFSDPIEEVLFLEQHISGLSNHSSVERKGHIFYELIEQDTLKGQVQKDSLLRVFYKGYLLDGKLIDVSPPDSGLMYRRGEQGQLIEGLDYIISESYYGDSLRIYLPPYLAFGSRGTANGVVPPNAPVAYSIRIQKVEESPN